MLNLFSWITQQEEEKRKKREESIRLAAEFAKSKAQQVKDYFTSGQVKQDIQNQPPVVTGFERIKQEFKKTPSQFNIFAQKPVKEVVETVPQYIKNRVIEPAISGTKYIGESMDINQPFPQRLKQAGVGALNLIGTALTVHPATAPAMLLWALTDAWKGAGKAQLNKESLLAQVAAAKKGFTGEEYTGLGSAITKNPLLEKGLNIAELPLSFLFVGAIKGPKGLPKFGKGAVAKEIAALEAEMEKITPGSAAKTRGLFNEINDIRRATFEATSPSLGGKKAISGNVFEEIGPNKYLNGLKEILEKMKIEVFKKGKVVEGETVRPQPAPATAIMPQFNAPTAPVPAAGPQFTAAVAAVPPVPLVAPLAPEKGQLVKNVKLLGKEGEGQLLETYKGRDIVKMPNGEIAVWSPEKQTLFRVALDDSTLQHKIIPEANNIKSAKSYIDWITKSQAEKVAQAKVEGFAVAEQQKVLPPEVGGVGEVTPQLVGQPAIPPTAPEIHSLIDDSYITEAHVANNFEEFKRAVQNIQNIPDSEISKVYETVKKQNTNPVFNAITNYKLAFSDTKAEADKLISVLKANPEIANKVATASKQKLIDENIKYLYRQGDPNGVSWSTKEKGLEFWKREGETLQKILITKEVIDRVVYYDNADIGAKLGFPNSGENEVILKPQGVEGVKPEPKLTTVKLEKQELGERFQNFISQAKTGESYTSRVNSLSKVADKPEISQDRAKLRQLRTLVRKEILSLTGLDAGGTGRWKQDFAYLQMIKTDPAISDQVTALEDLIFKLDEKIGSNVQAKIADFSEDLGLPATADYYIPVRKYSTRGTGNREWIQQNIPLVYMGNKRGMVGYILDVLGIKRDDLQFLNSQDTAHLPFTKVYDLFGGSGLLANLSTKLLPKAQVTYNEFDSQVVKAIETVKTNPRPVNRYIKEVGIWLDQHPGADWLAHFQLVHKTDPMFRVAAKLIEAAGGRTGEITAQKIANIVKAVPNYAKAFKDVKITNLDALKEMAKLARVGSPDTLLFIDPPYIWSSGYNAGTEMERTSGFMKLLDNLEALNKKGVKFIFFNNDPEVQVAKAGLESIHLPNIMGKINQLSEQGVTVIRGVKPIGAPDRREIMLTNLDYGKKTNRLLNQKWVMEAIAKLHAQPAAEMSKSFLSLLRSIRGSSEFAPGTQRISPNQIRMIRTLKNRLRIKNREMLPILDELLGDTSFAKMTKEDGEKMIAWLQPQNYRIIEKQVDLTKDRLGKARRQAILGEPTVAKDEELEKKFAIVDAVNRTAGDIENIVKMVDNLPKMEPPKWNNLRRALLLPAKALSEDLATKILGIKGSFHTPLRAIINLSTKFKNRMNINLARLVKDLSEEERKAVAFIQGGAEKEFKGTISPKARQVANYLQEVFQSELAMVNRLRQSVNKPPIPERSPYIPYILNQDILEAAHLGDRIKFWEQRVKTPKDFAAGLFSQDLDKIFRIWTESSANWLKKNLYQALLADKFEEIYKVSDAASMYARTIMEMDIYNMMGDFERSFRVIGQAINDSVGKIYPKRIPVNEELAKSLLNTTFGQELMDSIKHGYLYVPRFQLPNVSEVFHKVFYPAKLAWNFGFAVLNRQQPWAATPFVGVINKLKGRLKLYGVMMPWNGKTRDRYVSMLESSGYQFGRMVAGEALPTAKSKIGIFVDRSLNFLNDVTELANRMENAIDAEYVLASLEKKAGITLERRDKEKIAGQFSAFINFISGKGYAPVAQRNAIGRLLYTFQQYPIYQINVFHEMLKYALKDQGAAGFWQLMNDEGGASEKAYEAFEKLPDKSKGRLFAIFLAIAIPVATLYSMSRSWSVAARALPGIPRVAMNSIIKAIFAWMDDPSDDNKDALVSEIKGFFRVTVVQRVNDTLDVMKTGILQTSITGRPLFVDKTVANAVRIFVFGRSILNEYEKRYPSILSKIFGGQTEAGQVKKLQKSRLKQQQTDTENAVEFMKQLELRKTPEEKKALLKEFFDAGKINAQMKDKLKQYLTEKTKGTGGLERSISGLNDADQAQFVLDNLNKAKTVEEKKALLADYTQRGILTANVIAEMKKLLLAKKGL